MPELITAEAQKIEKINNDRYHIDFDPHAAVVIGTDAGNKLVPRATIVRFSGEAWLEVFYDRPWIGKTVVEEKDGADISGLKLDTDNGKEAVRCNAIDTKDGADKGGFEYDIVLYEKPVDEWVNTGPDETPVLLKANEFILRYRDSGNLRFLYQEPYSTATLSGEDALFVKTRDDTGGWDKDGNKVVDIPDWCVGSYAVYLDGHQPLYKNSAQAEKYAGGKLIHIHRPKIIDDRGSWVWGTVDVDTDAKTIKVTVPQDFLDKATYPVRVDPTFGYTTLGGTAYSSVDVIIGRATTSPAEDGTADSIHAGINSNWSAGTNWKCALYVESSGALLSPQSEILSGGHGTTQFVTFDITSGPSLTGSVDYVPVAWWDTTTSIQRDGGGSSGDSKYEELAYGAWPATVSWSNSSNLYSTYCTYSVAAAEWPHKVHGVGGSGGTTTYVTPGTDTYVVPAGVTSIIVKIWGAGGGGAGGGIGPSGDGDGGPGYAGGYVQATLTVTPLDTLNVSVGGGGDFGEGATTQSGGGGAGGGLTGLWDGAIATRGNALLVAGAGAGGGGGDNSAATNGGNGGGGGPNTGETGGSSGDAGGGTGGTQIGGGTGGSGTGTYTAGEDGETDGTYEGGDGAYHSASGPGANGGTGTQSGGDGGDEDTNGFAGGGGGGAGYYGGGGGCSSVSGNAGGGGGGGGSNYVSGASTTNTGATSQTPPNTGDDDYDADYGGGGNGGAQGGNDGTAGEGGRIVIIAAGSALAQVHQVPKTNTAVIAAVHGVAA